MECPECGYPVQFAELRFPTFPCPKCHRELLVPKTFQFSFHVVGAAIGFAGCYLIGLRNLLLLVAGLVVSLVVGGFLTMSAIAALRPELRIYIRDGSLGLK